jgi:hypothetical protein
VISDQRIAELMGWSANPAHVTGVLGGGPDDLPARVRAVAQAAAEAALAQPAQEPVAWLRRQELADLQTCNYRHLGADSPRIWAPHQPDAPAPELDLVAVYADPPRRAPYTDAPQRKPLTNEQIRRAKPVCAHFESFRAGIRFIEREIGLHA